jgi:hypothetical protein
MNQLSDFSVRPFDRYVGYKSVIDRMPDIRGL